MLSQRITSILTVILFLYTTSASSNELGNLGQFFKWSALIITQFDNVTLNGSSYCNGAYIGVKHVITAGMCVLGISKFMIKLGPHYAQYGVDVYELEFIYEKIIISTEGNRYDSEDKKLTVIQLDEDPRWPSGSYIQSITLPPRLTLSQLNDTLNPNKTAVEAGFILNEDGVFEQQWVDVTLLSSYDCWIAFPSVDIIGEQCSAGEKVGDKKRNLCPKIGNPLVAGDNTLIGIGTLENCVENGPQRFVRIRGYIRWIAYIIRTYKNRTKTT